MKLDNSNKRYSNIIAGILVIVVLSIFMGIFIGCWGNCIYEKEEAQLAFPLNKEDQVLSFDTGNINDEPAAQTSDMWTVDTAVGTLEYVEAGFYNSSHDLLIDLINPSVDDGFPLCIPEGMGYYFNITIKVTGGYYPAEPGVWWCNYLMLSQYKACDGLLHKYKIYFDYNDWDEKVFPCWKEFKLQAYVNDVYEYECGQWKQTATSMCFESNRKPDCSGSLGKWITAELKSSWEGCPLDTQEFCCSKHWYCLNTEKGEMIVLPIGIFDSNFKFDLCYEPNDNLGLIYLHVTGGFTPLGIDNITIWQEKSIATLPSYGIYDVVNLSWAEFDENNVLHTADGAYDLTSYMDGCCETVWVGNVTFGAGQVIDDTGQATDLMKFDSNHTPACCWPPKTLDKPVRVNISSIWSGCGQQSQQFTYMLVHKNNISGVPNSRFHRQLNVIIFRHTFKIAV